MHAEADEACGIYFRVLSELCRWVHPISVSFGTHIGAHSTADEFLPSSAISLLPMRHLLLLFGGCAAVTPLFSTTQKQQPLLRQACRVELSCGECPKIDKKIGLKVFCLPWFLLVTKK
jgi:hypothetical protein